MEYIMPIAMMSVLYGICYGAWKYAQKQKEKHERWAREDAEFTIRMIQENSRPTYYEDKTPKDFSITKENGNV